MASSSSNPFLFGFLSLVCFFFFVIDNKPFVSAITKQHSDQLQHTHHHHHVALSSFFLSSSCTSPPQGTGRKGSLEVIHRHGPCSELKQQTLPRSSSVKAPLIIPHSEILEQDKARVRAIHSKLREDGRATRTSEASDQAAAAAPAPAEAPLPTQSGANLGYPNYFVKVGLGTPARELSLAFDTGSDLTWTQCLPCLGSCYSQIEPIFDPSHSSSYSDIPCTSSQCSQISPDTGKQPECSESRRTCQYDTGYGDNSFSIGNLANETLTITPTDVVDNFLFGCGHNNGGSFKGVAGLLGLGRNPISFVEQTSDLFHKTFSYCLPPTTSDVGYLTFGGVPDSDNITYTPFFSPSQGPISLYALNFTGISVAGVSLSIPSSVFSSTDVIIDSGTVLTRLPSEAYGPLRDAFRKAMSKYPMLYPNRFLDTCYDLSGYNSVVVPKVILSFGGGANVELDASGVLFAVSETQVCLAFVANEDPSSPTIIGNTQQRTIEVVYDVGAGKIGFRPRSCMGNSKVSTTGASTANLTRPPLIWIVQIYFIYIFYILLFL